VWVSSTGSRAGGRTCRGCLGRARGSRTKEKEKKPKEKERTQALERGGDKTFVGEKSLEISTDKTFERELQ
jgi:hypothetical protein